MSPLSKDIPADLEQSMYLILWSEPYSSYFSLHHGGLPGDWVRQGLVTPLSIARAQVGTDQENVWSRQELERAKAEKEAQT